MNTANTAVTFISQSSGTSQIITGVWNDDIHLLLTIPTADFGTFTLDFSALESTDGLGVWEGDRTVTFEIEYIPIIVVQADAAGDMQIYNKWTTPILVNGTSVEVNGNIIIAVQIGDIVKVKESSKNVTFRSWKNVTNPLVKTVSSHIIKMPPMNRFTTDVAGTKGGNYFFYYFNGGNGALTSLPAGSFDTSNISGAQGTYFFGAFNYNGALTSLPAGSFDTSNISGAQGTYFFYQFNHYGVLTSLPDGSFNTDNISGAQGFFTSFNYNGKIPRDTTSPNRIIIPNNTSAAITFNYWNGSSSIAVSVPAGETFDGYAAS